MGFLLIDGDIYLAYTTRTYNFLKTALLDGGKQWNKRADLLYPYGSSIANWELDHLKLTPKMFKGSFD